MTYYINPIWFYLMDICNNLQIVFTVLAVVLAVIGIGFLIAIPCIISEGHEEDSPEIKKVKKIFIKAFILCGIFVTLAVATPSKDALTKMLIASVVTQENVEKAKGDVKELVDYVVEKTTELNEKEKDKE